MAQPYDLTQLDPASFEHMVNFLALRVLGSGSTGFGPGPDGGRDGYFKGEAPYPSITDRWAGDWCIQSKFHKPSLSPNPNKWLIKQVKLEIDAYKAKDSKRVIPDIWIIATNIEPSNTAQSGAVDKIKKMVADTLGTSVKVEIWGGRKILDFLAEHPQVSEYYGHFLTPGHILTTLQNSMRDSSAQVESIISHLITSNFIDQTYTKLDQAGSESDSTRPKIHDLFIDLPYRTDSISDKCIFTEIVSSSGNNHRNNTWLSFGNAWEKWSHNPSRARITVIKGGPGQGKSTVGQYFSQIQRAAFILADDGPNVRAAVKTTCEELKTKAVLDGFWPTVPRIPITVELKDFAKWYGGREEHEPKNILSYVSHRIKIKMGEVVHVGTLKRALREGSWFVAFDGLDEVPNDVKDSVADEIIEFTNELVPELNADVQILCTTRPQGYSGQFERMEACTVNLCNLPREIALRCASALVVYGRTSEESDNSIATLEAAMESEQVRELMTTPLQSHIMAVLVRNGGRPPEKRWQLFENFYQVMKKRETLKGFGKPQVARLISDNDPLLRAIHSRLGVSLHAKAESSDGAETTLAMPEFKKLAAETTHMLIEENVEEVVDALMEATTERLVFVNTPDDNKSVRFDIRQLQEFFAGEFIYSKVELPELQSRIKTIGSDSHWREVMHFMLSGLIAGNRSIELSIVVEALCNLDGSNDSSETRTFDHRTGAGAILTLRLLNEGVLEQDRGIRNRFLPALRPVFSSLDPQVLETLSEVSHRNSEAWLLNSMADAVVELSESEQIAAAIVLTRKLQTDHARHAEVEDRILKSSTNYLQEIVEANINQHVLKFAFLDRKIQLSSWFLRATIKLVYTWKFEDSTHRNISLASVLNLLRRFKLPSLTLINEEFSNDHLYFTALISSNDPTSDIASGTSSFEVLTYESTWRNNSLPTLLSFTPDLSTQVPIFEFLNSVIKFAKQKTLDNYKSIITQLIEFECLPDFIPDYIKALIPLNFHVPFYTKNLDAQLTITASEFSEIIDSGYFRGHLIHPQSKLLTFSDFQIDTWQATCFRLPSLALELWFTQSPIVNDPMVLASPEYSDEILKLAKSSPGYFSKHIHAWGKLFDAYPSERDQLVSNFSPYLFSTDLTMVSAMDVHPFQIFLPEEKHLLVPLAQSLVNLKISSLGFAFGRRRFRTDASKLGDGAISKFGLSSSALIEVINDASNHSDVRRSALVIYLCYQFDDEPAAPSNLLKGFSDEFYSLLKGSNDWFPLAGLILAQINLTTYESQAKLFVNDLLNLYRDNYAVARNAQHLVALWRERSTAPVQSNNQLENWLDYRVPE